MKLPQDLTSAQRRVLKRLVAGPIAWGATTMADADTLDTLVTLGFVVRSVEPGGVCPKTWYHLHSLACGRRQQVKESGLD